MLSALYNLLLSENGESLGEVRRELARSSTAQRGDWGSPETERSPVTEARALSSIWCFGRSL